MKFPYMVKIKADCTEIFFGTLSHGSVSYYSVNDKKTYKPKDGYVYVNPNFITHLHNSDDGKRVIIHLRDNYAIHAEMTMEELNDTLMEYYNPGYMRDKSNLRSGPDF